VALKGGQEGRVGGERGMGASKVFGPFVCLGAFLLLWWRMFVLGIAGGCYSRLVS
jgi:hypothetical protein